MEQINEKKELLPLYYKVVFSHVIGDKIMFSTTLPIYSETGALSNEQIKSRIDEVFDLKGSSGVTLINHKDEVVESEYHYLVKTFPVKPKKIVFFAQLKALDEKRYLASINGHIYDSDGTYRNARYIAEIFEYQTERLVSTLSIEENMSQGGAIANYHSSNVMNDALYFLTKQGIDFYCKKNEI